MKGIAFLLGGILAAILIIVVVAVMPSLDDRSAGMEYDDYLEVDAISAGGSLEIVEIAGRTYAHAVGIGDGYYKSPDGRETHVEVSKARLDVIVAMGQSNNRYTCWDISKVSAFPELGKAYYWGTEFEPVTNPNVQGASIQELRDPETGAVKLGDKVPTFCAAWTESTGHKVLYVITAVGGSSITSWVPGEQQYQRQIRILNQATGAIDSSLYDWQVACCTWIQGEEDWQMPLEDYMGYMGQMLDGLFSETYPYRMNYMVMATPRLGTAVEADRLVSEEREDVILATDVATTFTTANGLLGPDNTHWTQEGDNLVAEAMSEAALKRGGSEGWLIPLLIGVMVVFAAAGVMIYRRGS